MTARRAANPIPIEPPPADKARLAALSDRELADAYRTQHDDIHQGTADARDRANRTICWYLWEARRRGLSLDRTSPKEIPPMPRSSSPNMPYPMPDAGPSTAMVRAQNPALPRGYLVRYLGKSGSSQHKEETVQRHPNETEDDMLLRLAKHAKHDEIVEIDDGKAYRRRVRIMKQGTKHGFTPVAQHGERAQNPVRRVAGAPKHLDVVLGEADTVFLDGEPVASVGDGNASLADARDGTAMVLTLTYAGKRWTSMPVPYGRPAAIRLVPAKASGRASNPADCGCSHEGPREGNPVGTRNKAMGTRVTVTPRPNEHGEYIVRHWVNGEMVGEYFTNDREDAEGTGHHLRGAHHGHPRADLAKFEGTKQGPIPRSGNPTRLPRRGYRISAYDGLYLARNLAPTETGHKVMRYVEKQDEALRVAEDWLREHPPRSENAFLTVEKLSASYAPVAFAAWRSYGDEWEQTLAPEPAKSSPRSKGKKKPGAEPDWNSKINDADRALISMTLGGVHAATPPEEIVQMLLKRWPGHEDTPLVRSVIEAALDIHYANFRTYYWVMSQRDMPERRSDAGPAWSTEQAWPQGRAGNPTLQAWRY